ncbi:MAG: orotidine-5'-phosphate decarboxylase [Candidatus Omnitrophica bacterium]|nr:orotidine-5'-phosphate decarboxylase [Candidatus Omnitrophota bacterium]
MLKKAWEKLIVALDIPIEKKIKEVVQALYPKVKKFKVGLITYTLLGPKIIKWINNQGGEVFLDLKFFDIPNTMSEAARIAMEMGVWAFTVHLRSGKESLQFLKEQLVSRAKSRGYRLPLIIGVTELTSQKVSLSKVMALAKVAYESKLDGVVCSVWEARKIKEAFGLLTITPGIRGKKEDDQIRIATVRDALKEDVDYFVIGRPIIKERDYLKAAKKLLEEEGRR